MSEGNVVVLRRVVVLGRLAGRGCADGGAARGGAGTRGAPGAPVALSAAATLRVDELEVLDDDADLAVLLAVLLPGVELEAALQEDLPALLHVAGDGLARAAPGFAVEETGLLDLLAGLLAVVGAVHGQAEGHDRGAPLSGAALGVAREAADQQDFVQVGHGGLRSVRAAGTLSATSGGSLSRRNRLVPV